MVILFLFFNTTYDGNTIREIYYFHNQWNRNHISFLDISFSVEYDSYSFKIHSESSVLQNIFNF